MPGQYQKLKVVKKVRESELVSTLYLKPIDDTPIKDFKPGQHLLFKIKPNGQDHFIQRFYSFSDAPHKDYYRISVKKELPPLESPQVPPGKSSTLLHEVISEGQVLEARGPMGAFYLNLDETQPIALIAGGIGITPLLSMVNAVAEGMSNQEIWLFFGVTNSKDHIFKQHLEEIESSHSNIHVFTYYWRPLDDDRLNQDYDFEGFVDIEFIKGKLPTHVKDFYICGPIVMMANITSGLQNWGVTSEHIFSESFGPSSVAYKDMEIEEQEGDSETITFSVSGQTIAWDSKFESIVEFAEANDIEIDVGCLFGDCGTCMTELLSGEVQYNHKTMIEPDPGTCLPCSSRPKGNITLEL